MSDRAYELVRWRAMVALTVAAVAGLLAGCASAGGAEFELPGVVTGGAQRSNGELVAFVLIGRRVVAVPVDHASFAALRRGQLVVVTGQIRGQSAKRLALRLPNGTVASAGLGDGPTSNGVDT